MPAPANLGFETVGAAAGDAASWTRAIVSSAITIGNYNGGAGAPRPIEAFEVGWFFDAFDLSSLGTTTGLYGGIAFDGFETWAVPYAVTLSSATGGNADTFEDGTGWFTGPFLLAIAAFTSGNADTFEDGTGWFSAYALTIGASTTGQYFGLSAERFENVVPSLTFTVAPGNPGVFTVVAHPFINGQHVVVKEAGGGALAGGLSDQAAYTVTVINANTFSLVDINAIPVVITTAGSGIQTISGDPAYSWPA